jgi:hypothetical protein
MRSTALGLLGFGWVDDPARAVPRPSFSRLSWQFVAVCLGLSLLPDSAAAFQTESAATDGCHEKLTTRAWNSVREELPETTAPLASRGDDAALIADVPFSVPSSMEHIGGVTLLLGVRDNDLKEHGPTDLKNLAPEASDPKTQHEHCLRAPGQDEPGGSAEAVESCRNYIRDMLLSSLDGLDEQGMPDTRKRETLKVSLAIRDEIDVEVPKFFVRAGRALHAIQDSFTHTFRRENSGKITVVLNWVDYTNNTLDEAVDGPPHASELDVCDAADEIRTERRQFAQDASSEALMAVLEPATTSAKEAAIDSMLDRYVAYDETADCSLENNWCDAPERQYGSPTLGCAYGGVMPKGGLLALAPLGGLVLLRLRRRRSLVTAATLAGALVLGHSAAARADDKSGPIDGPASALAGESDSATVGKIERAGAFFGRLAVGASYDNAALSGGLGIRYQFSRNWMLGLDGEWNPYIATSPGKIRSGSANAYLSIVRRFQLRWETVNVRSTASVGGSMLLFDLVGADKYSVGPYFGVSFLGAEIKAARGFYVTIDPTYIAIPIPSVTGVPFMYAQYRFMVGVEFGG